jgi:UDP-N-acetylmuramoylalanine--D-glutamate ligase
MQLVRRLNGSAWYNDSKGTNVGSVVKSLSGISGSVVLIAGGKDKGGDYSPLRRLMEQKVSHLILIGEAAERMAVELAGTCEIIFAADLAEAVQQASIVVGQGGTVVLSPACSSYDMFPNYEVRGDCFEQLVLQLTDKQGPS